MFLFQNLGLYMNNKQVQSEVHTTAIQSSKQQSDKAHCYHQEQRAHHHGSTGSTNSTGSIHSSGSVHCSGSTTKNLRTLAAGDRWVVWIAVVRCSIVTHDIGKIFSCVPTKILKPNQKKRKKETSCLVHISVTEEEKYIQQIMNS